MPIQKPVSFKLSDEYSQLALALDLPEVELEQMSQEQARVKHEAGRAAFLALKGKAGQPDWFSRFEMLIDSGWTWRQACYIAWASTPLEGREPKTQEELATKFLNLSSDRAISMWKKKNPAIEGMISVMQTMELWEHRADSFQNLIKGMKQAGTDYKFFNHLKLYLEMTGDYVPLNQVAAVLKRKAEGGAHELEESTLDDLAQGAEELAGMINPSPSPIVASQTESEDDEVSE